MGDSLENTTATEPVDGVSDMQQAKDPLMSPHAQYFHNARTYGLAVNRHPHRVLALMTNMCWWAIKQQNKQNNFQSPSLWLHSPPPFEMEVKG
jgi:hypothetical protein